MCASHNAPVDVGGKRVGVSSLSPCGSWGSNSGSQAWWQASLPTEPAHSSHLQYYVQFRVMCLVPVSPRITSYDSDSNIEYTFITSFR